MNGKVRKNEDYARTVTRAETISTAVENEKESCPKESLKRSGQR